MKAIPLEAGDFAETVPLKAGVDNNAGDLILLQGMASQSWWPSRTDSSTFQHGHPNRRVQNFRKDLFPHFFPPGKNVLVSLKSASVMRY